jgi:hypothetical protein
VKRNGIILAGGILGVLRGAFGAVFGLLGLATVAQIEQVLPGYTSIFVFELLLSLVVLAVGIYAIVKSNDPTTAGTVRVLGIAIIVGGVVDAVWGSALLQGTSSGTSSAFGSLVALAVIGVLLVLGAQHWRRNALQP